MDPRRAPARHRRDQTRSRKAVADAIRELHGAGLLNITGELVTPSRAARKMDELSDGAL